MTHYEVHMTQKRRSLGLLHRHVHRGSARLLHVGLHDIVHDADDRQPILWFRLVCHRHALADGVAVWPKLFGERLADDDHTRSARAILLVEVASRANALTHRAEVTRAGRRLVSPRDAFGKLSSVLENEVTSNESAAERCPVHYTSSLDAGDCAQPLEHTPAEFL